jgi:peroxiredoxin
MPTTDHPPSPTRARRLAGWLANLALILAIVLGVQWWTARPLATGQAPPLTGVTLDGQPIDLADLRGEPVLVHFWATWCPVCKMGNAAIDAIARDHRVLTVALQSGGPTAIRRFMTTASLGFTTIPDDDGLIAARWGVPGVPASFIIDPQGRIDSSTMGFSTETGLRARLWAAGRRGAQTAAH